MDKFLLILKMLPGILGVVVAVEDAVTTPKSGPTKLDLVVKTISAAAASTPEIISTVSAGEVEQATIAIATAAVTTMNAAGLFKTS